MTLLAPGSLPWLVRHELRLSWRGLFIMRLAAPIRAALAIMAVSIGFGLAWLLAHGAAPRTDVAIIVADLVPSLGFVFTLTALQSASTLYQRQDIAWLLASPLPFRRLLVALILGLALQARVIWPLFLIVPLSVGLAVLGRPSALAAPLVLFAMISAATTVFAGVVITAASILGQRGMRTALNGTMVAFLSGFAILLAWRGGSGRAKLSRATLFAPLTRAGVDLDAVGSTIARAMLGEARPLATVLLISFGSTFLTGWLLERRFVAGALSADGRGGLAAARSARFPSGLVPALLRKEARLLRRTPNLAFLVLLRMAVLIPMFFVTAQGVPVSPSALLVFMVGISGQIARVITSAAIASDGSGQLIRTAPIRARAQSGVKATVAGGAVAASLMLPCCYVAWAQPRLLPVFALGLLGAAGSATWLTLRRPAVPSATDLGAVPATMSGTGWLIVVVSLLWAGAVQAVLAALGHP